MKLPSTRALANELNPSGNTVFNAYRQLLTEGYLEGRARSGTFVAHVLPETLLTAPRRFDTVSERRTVNASHSKPKAAPPQKAESPRILFSDHARAQIAVAQPPSNGKLPRLFLAEAPALDVFPHKLWSRLVVRQARQLPVNNFAYQDSSGYRPLREAIAAHVTVSRQVHCRPEQVMIVPGSPPCGYTLGGLFLLTTEKRSSCSCSASPDSQGCGELRNTF